MAASVHVERIESEFAEPLNPKLAPLRLKDSSPNLLTIEILFVADGFSHTVLLLHPLPQLC